MSNIDRLQTPMRNEFKINLATHYVRVILETEKGKTDRAGGFILWEDWFINRFQIRYTKKIGNR